MEMQVIECPECRTKNPSDSISCSHCGTQFGFNLVESLDFTRTLLTPAEGLTKGSTLAQRYVISEELGQGGMGFVYKVFDTKIQEDVALKVIKPEVAAHRDTITRFSNELKFARRITHKNVCRMHDINEAAGTHFITMEYVEGETLKSVIKRKGRLKLGNALGIALQVADGLAEAHSLGIVHRDLKPQNIMIDKEGNAKIMDFGIARSMESKGLTAEGVVIGTPEYMSPEQVEGKQADQRSDIYSLGVMLYEMTTGHVPFKGDSAFSVALKHKSQEPVDPRQANPKLPEGLARAILRCMEKEGSRRYQSAGELLAVLLAVEEMLPEKERVAQKILPRAAAARREKARLKRIFAPALAAAAVVAAGILAWQLLNPTQPALVEPGRPTIAILPVKNNTVDPELDDYREILQELLIADMMSSKYLHVLDFSRMYSVLTETGLLETKNYTEKHLGDLAGESKATHIILLSLIKAGENFRIIATLKETRTMNTIASEEAEVTGVDNLSLLADSLTPKFKPYFNLTADQIADDYDEVIAAVTTENPKALKYYLEAIKALNRSDPEQAAGLLEQAVVIDPDFAMAHWILSRAYMQQMPSIDQENIYSKYVEARQTAYDAMQRRPISDRERLLIEAFHVQGYWSQGDHRILEKLVELYPEDVMGNGYLGQFYWMQEEFEKAEMHYEVLVRNNTALAAAYLQLSQVYFLQGFNEKAKEIAELGLDRFPDSWNISCVLPDPFIAEGKYEEALTKWEDFFLANPTGSEQCRKKAIIFLFQEDFDAAEEEYRKLLTKESDTDIWAGMTHLIELYSLQGRFEEAFAQIEAAKKKWGEEDEDINDVLSLMYMRRGQLDKALEAARLSRGGGEAVLYAKAKLWEDADNILENYRLVMEKQTNQLGFPRKQTLRYYLQKLGEIERERGNLTLAIEYFDQVKSLFTGVQYQNFAASVENLASSYYEAGDLGRAAEEFELITTLTWGRIKHGEIYAKSFYILGRIYEELGKKKDARRNYERFLDLWKIADPGLPEVEDARTRLADL